MKETIVFTLIYINLLDHDVLHKTLLIGKFLQIIIYSNSYCQGKLENSQNKNI